MYLFFNYVIPLYVICYSPSLSLILRTHTHSQFPSQEHFRRVGLDTLTTLALSLASQISHINRRDSRCCREAKSLRLLCRARGPPRLSVLGPAKHVARLTPNAVFFCTEARPRVTMLLQIYIAVSFHLYPDNKKTQRRSVKGASVPGQCSTAAFLWFQT